MYKVQNHYLKIIMYSLFKFTDIKWKLDCRYGYDICE